MPSSCSVSAESQSCAHQGALGLKKGEVKMKSKGRINKRQERSLTVEVTPQEALTNKKKCSC